MKKIIILIGITLISSFLFAKEKKINCESTLAKLKPECNFIGSGVKNLKKFSSKHKTVGETLGIDKKEKKTLREFSEENKTLGQTFRNIKKKFKKNNDN